MWKWIKPREAPVHLGRMTRHTVADRHVALYDYLDHRFASVLVLTFGQIEDLLGCSLPDSARTRQEWWTTADAQTDVPPCSEAWISAGRTARPNLQARTVTFERAALPRS